MGTITTRGYQMKAIGNNCLQRATSKLAGPIEGSNDLLCRMVKIRFSQEKASQGCLHSPRPAFLI
jgi:hypothetical protein